MSGTTLRNYTMYVRDAYEAQFGPIDRSRCSEWFLKGLEKLDRYEHRKSYDSLSQQELVELDAQDMERRHNSDRVTFKERLESEREAQWQRKVKKHADRQDKILRDLLAWSEQRNARNLNADAMRQFQRHYGASVPLTEGVTNLELQKVCEKLEPLGWIQTADGWKR